MSFADIVKYGKFYNPASLHYGNNTSVMCDRCKRKRLNACIGYMNEDLCLECTEYIVNKQAETDANRPPMTIPTSIPREELTFTAPPRFFDNDDLDSRPLSKMLTDRFGPYNSYK